MDIDEINALNDGQKERYMAMQRLFEHPSYKFLIEWAKAQYLECTARLITATNWEQHCAQFGARAAYESFVNLENSVEAEFQLHAKNAIDAKIESMTEAEDE